MRESSPTPYVGPPPVPKMPAGLVELVEGLTREVLINNPRDLYGFCAKHLEKLLEVRDGRPVRNPVLTIEEKIRTAQEKVRHKAKERREKYDQEINALQQSEHHDVTNDKTINNPEEITKPPVHEDQKLALDSEVEIAHKSYDHDINIDKNNFVVKLPEISIQKPDENSSNFEQEDLANEKLTQQSMENKQLLSPKNGEIVNTSNNDIIVNSLEEESIILPIANENLKEEMNTEDEEKPETKDAEFKAFLENPSVNVDVHINEDIHNNEELMLDSESDIGTGQVANVPLLTNNTDTNTIQDNETSRTFFQVIANDITEPLSIKDSNEVNTITDKNITNDNEEVQSNVKNEVTNVVKDIDIESIDNGDGSQEVVKEVDQLSDTQRDLKTNDVSEISSLITNTESTAGGPQELNKDKVRIITNGDLPSDVNESVSFANNTINDDGLLKNTKDSINIINDTVVSDISKDTKVNDEVKSEQSKTMESVIEINNDSGQSNLHVETKEDDSIVDVNITEDESTKVKATTEKEIEQVNDDNSSTKIPEIDDVNEHTKSFTRSDVSKIEDNIVQENQNDQSNMDLETAAVTIQKVFRSFLFKSRNSTFDDITNDETTSLEEDNDKKEEYYAAANINKERRALGINRMDTVLQTVNEEKSLSLSTDDSSTLSSAATTIQAHVRGFLVRNRLNSNKTVSTTSLANSNENLEFDTDQQKNKTVLNIHIVPEEANYLSRDESIITSMELSLDGSPPSSISLHPLSYDVSERRKLLKREDAVQSISPPSNNSGKLSEESVKEVFINDDTLVNVEIEKGPEVITEPCNDSGVDSEIISTSSTVTATTVINVTDLNKSPTNLETEHRRSKSVQKIGSDESDVVTPYDASPRSSIGDYENTSKLVHSGEFHDVLLPTRVSRSDTTVVRGE